MNQKPSVVLIPQKPLFALMHWLRALSSCSALGLAVCRVTWIWKRRGQYLPVMNTRSVAGSHAMPAHITTHSIVKSAA